MAMTADQTKQVIADMLDAQRRGENVVIMGHRYQVGEVRCLHTHYHMFHWSIELLSIECCAQKALLTYDTTDNKLPLPTGHVPKDENEEFLEWCGLENF